MAMGSLAAVLAVVQRWSWWLRAAIYAVWIISFFLAGGFIRTASSSQMPILEARGYFYSLWGSVIVAGLIVIAVIHQRRMNVAASQDT